MADQHTKHPRENAGKTGGKPGTQAHFGYQPVAEDARQDMVQGVFDRVARRYDLMNDLMSGGVHRLWKSAFIDWLAPRPGMQVLDVAGGTGDIAFRILERINRRAHVTVCDINEAMVRVGRDKALDRGIASEIEWVVGNAEALPVADASMDAYTIAFGLRNVTHIDRALAEARRVLKPGGRFLCLEFSRVKVPLLGPLYDRYSFEVVPRIGEIVARDRAAYQYLVESIRRFPDQETLAEMIAAAGLEMVKVRNLSGGIAAMHSAWRL